MVGAVTGALGAGTGAASGYYAAYKAGLNPWTGSLKPQENYTIVRHHSPIENIKSIDNMREIRPGGRKAPLDFYGVDVESTNFTGVQKFGGFSDHAGAFIEMKLPSDILTPFPNLEGFQNYYRINTGLNNNFIIQERFTPQIYRNYTTFKY